MHTNTASPASVRYDCERPGLEILHIESRHHWQGGREGQRRCRSIISLLAINTKDAFCIDLAPTLGHRHSEGESLQALPAALASQGSSLGSLILAFARSPNNNSSLPCYQAFKMIAALCGENVRLFPGL